ncbi:cell division protein ZapA [Sphingomonas jatrophae]|uniref:Cell division protein ZapA n=1 Tax=Sphingomonas jatrophae TaxID=1166337 RepID=A0A1I6L9Y4_9SPHN|nr:cell division protein ZapA [Sphingomonas jatrophae]SFS00204.1 cell division protein ZapA [Sphingomonas jatrophae]
MARVTLNVAGRPYDIAVRDGDEPRFTELARLVDDKAMQAARGMGGLTEGRQLLFAALLLADELDAARAAAAAPAPAPAPTLDPAALERLADRAEALAEQLEQARA